MAGVMSRYLMKKTLLVFMLLSLSFNTFASKCMSRDFSDEYPVKITHQKEFMIGMHEYTVTVPSEIESQKIINIYLFTADDKGLVQSNLMVPISYDLIKDSANAKFSVNPKAANYKIQVWYGGVCGPRVWYAVKST